jgi:hypothetical protein
MREQHGLMLALVLGMLLCVSLAVAVVGLVAIPARREGREMLTPKGEEVVSRVRAKTGLTAGTAQDDTGEAVDPAHDTVVDVTGVDVTGADVTVPKDD